MSSIDNRIVKLDLENREFEKNASMSTKTLDRLKEALNFNKQSKELNEFNKTSNSMSFSGISSAIDKINSRFSTMGIIGMSALQNLTNSAINLGKKLTTAIFNPLVEGGKRRALNIEQAKFQLEGLGVAWKSIEDDINYGVKDTAYGLDVAAKAASQLVASGVQVGDSMKTALRGISGVAAMANASYEEISPIFTTVAGQGKLMTMQLRQLENRGLNAAATIGKYLGKTEAEIRDMVSKGKIDFATFAAAMDDAFGAHAKDANKTFTGAMSNVKAALSRIGAKFATPAFEGLRRMFVSLIPVINNINSQLTPLVSLFEKFIDLAATKVEKVLGNVKIDLSWLTLVADILNEVWESVSRLANIIRLAFNDIFPKSVETSTGKVIKLSRTMSEKLTYIFEKVGTIVKKVSDSIIKNKDKLQRTFKGLFAIFDIGKTILTRFAKVLEPVFGIFAEKAGGILGVTASIGDFLVKISEAIKKSKTLSFIFDTLSKGLTKIKDILHSTTESVSKFVKFIKEKLTIKNISGDLMSGLTNLKDGILNVFNNPDAEKAMKTGLFGLMIYWTKRLSNNLFSLTELLSGQKTSLWASLKGTMGQLKSTLFSWQQDLNADRLLKIGGAVAILAAGLLVLSSIPAGKLYKAGIAMVSLFEMLIGSLKIFDKYFDANKMLKLNLADGIFIKLAGSILIMSFAMKVLSSIDWGGMVRGLISMTTMCALIVASSILLSRNEGNFKKAAKALMPFATSMVIFAAAFKIFEKVDWGGIGKSLLSIAGIILIISTFATITKNVTDGISKLAFSMILFGTSMIIFAKAFSKFSQLNLKDIGTGLLAMAGIFAEILVVCAINNKIGDNSIIKLGASLILIGMAMKILSGVMLQLSQLNLKGIGLGLLAMAGILAIITLAANFMPKNLLLTAAGMIVMAAAVKILSSALVVLSKLSIGEILKGLLTITGTFVILGAAAAILAPLIPVMAGLAGVLALLGVASLALATGLLLLSKAIVLFQVSATAGFAATFTIISGFLDLLPKFGEKLGLAFISFITVINQNFPVILDSIGLLILGILEKINEYIPKFVETGLNLLVSLLTGINDNIREITKVAIEIIANFINGLADGLPKLINAGWNLIISFINGLADSINKNMPRLIAAGNNLMMSMLNAMKLAIVNFKDTFIEKGKDLINGFIQGIKSKISDAVTAVKDLGNRVVSKIKEKLKISSPSKVFEGIGMYSDMGFANGLIRYSKLAENAAEDLGNSAINSVNDSLSGISKIFSNANDDFTIKPILDLSDINNKKKQLNSMFSNNRTLSLTSSLGGSKESYNGSPAGINNFSFTQNNYSPKALSRIDIYRQTKNQFAKMKEVVNG